jgi:methionyl-tRNA synthetase
MLLYVGIPLPKKVFSHGWWTVDGQQMSKSRGNFVDPLDIADRYSVDALRYFLVRELPLGDDGDFSEKALIARINVELVADLGNLIYRTLTLAEKFTGEFQGHAELESKLDIPKIERKMGDLDTFGALNDIWSFIRETNKYVNEKEVWKLQGAELSNALYNLLEACRVISILISPFMPNASSKINAQLGVKHGTLDDCKFGRFEGHVKKGGYIFQKVEQKA